MGLNRFQPDRNNLPQILHLYHFVRPQAQQRLVVRKPDGSERTLDVISKVTTRRITELDDLLGEILETIWRERDRYAPVGADILVWRMTGFGNPESVQELGQALRNAAIDAELREELRQKGLARAAAFTWAKAVESTWGVYGELL